MKHKGSPDRHEIGNAGLIVQLHPVVEAESSAVHVHLIERFAHVQQIPVHISGGIRVPEVWHHVSAVEKAALGAHLPVPHVRGQLTAKCECVVPYVRPVVLEQLEPPYGETEPLEPGYA